MPEVPGYLVALLRVGMALARKLYPDLLMMRESIRNSFFLM